MYILHFSYKKPPLVSTMGQQDMKNNHPRLLRIKHSYYIRVAIPRNLQSVIKRKQFKHSLKTNDYYEALKRVRTLSLFFDELIALYGKIKMKITTVDNKEVIEIDYFDVDRVLLCRLEQIDWLVRYTKYGEEKFRDFSDVGVFGEANYLQFSGDAQTDKNIKWSKQYSLFDFNCAVYEWESEMVNLLLTGKLDNTVSSIINRFMNNELEFMYPKNGMCNTPSDVCFMEYIGKLKDLEKYGNSLLKAIQNGDDEGCVSVPTTLVSLYETLQDKQNKQRLKQAHINTNWRDLFTRYIDYKKSYRAITPKTITKYESQLETCFDLLNIQYVEEVNNNDLSQLVLLLRKLPKFWKQKYPNKKVRDIVSLNLDSSQTLELKTVQTYVVSFNNFMEYAQTNIDGLDLSVKKIKLPSVSRKSKVLPWTDDDLLKLFSPEVYPKRYERTSFARFWIPLISIFHGCRETEIAQLKVKDIVKYEGIYCFNITNEGENQSVKNDDSCRLVPIHKNIIDLGFLDLVKTLKNKGVDRIFHTLTSTPKSSFGDKISKWFGRYKKQFGYKGRTKSFHSFRHNFATQCANRHITAEVINSICGWTNNGVGQRVYTKIQLKTMKEVIDGVTYPFYEKYCDAYKLQEGQKDTSTCFIKQNKKLCKK